MRKAVLFLTLALIGAPSLSFAAETPVAPQTAAPQPAAAAFTDAQRAEIENIIKEYIAEKHPEVLEQGLQTLQKRERDTAESKTKEQITGEKDKIYNDSTSPISGNPKGNVTIVEFYDYQCGYCKMSEEAVERLVKEDKNIKFVYKEFPILGPVSAEASKAALASVKQNKFVAFHDAMMNKKDHLTSDMIYLIAKDVGLDVEKLKKDMNDSALNDTLNNNLKLGQDIGVHGTPMFIINDNVFPGALQYDQLKQAITDARSGKKS